MALLDLFARTQDQRYLDAAKWSADWALTRRLVVNWNYNSFSVWLLARIYRVTGETRYLEAATRKALLGVLPGQLTSGAHAGRWNDAHNAKPAYHYILLRSLVELHAAMPSTHPDRASVRAALRLGLMARNKDFIARGASNKDSAMEVLLLVNRTFADDRAFLVETGSIDALDALGKLVSAQMRRGNAALGPRALGQFLEHIAEKGPR